MNLIKTIKTLPLTIAAAALLAAVPMPQGTPLFGESAAHAQGRAPTSAKKKKSTRKVPALSGDFFKQIEKAQEAMDEQDNAKAMEVLESALQRRKVNDYERSVAWQMQAMIMYEQEDVRGTIRVFEKILTVKDSIPEAQEYNTIYSLAQLYFGEEDYDTSLRYVKQWQSKIDPTLISVSHLTFISNLYYVREEFEESLEYIYRAIETAKTIDTVEVKEGWYSLALSAHWELGQLEKARDVLEIMLITWPKPQYWIQLAGVYQELGDEPTSYSLTEAAYKQGFLDDKETQLVNVAQIQLARGAPIKCTWVFEKAFKDGRVEKTPANQKTLGQCYLMASEYESALDPLSVAAADDADGDLWFQIGQVQMQLGKYKDAVESFGSVIEAFDKDRKDTKNKDRAAKALSTTLRAEMQRGQALTELKRYKEAHDSFNRASRLAKARKDKRMVTQWRNYLRAEEAREQMLKG